MANTGKEAIKFKDIPIEPKAIEGINHTIEWVMSAIRYHYPAIKLENINGEVTEDSMIRSAEQVHSVEAEDLPKIEQAEKRADDIFLYTLLKESGIPEDQLIQRIHRTKQGESFYFNPYTSQPSRTQVYFDHGYFDNFLPEDIEGQMLATFNLGVALIETNFNLAPTPREIPTDSRERFKSYVIGQKEGLISFLESPNQQNVDSQITEVADEVGNLKPVRNIDITRALMDEFILKEKEGYNPRFVAYGGKVLFLMPHQSLITAELALGAVLQRDICQYLSRPVLDMFFELLAESFGLKGRLNRKYFYDKFLPADFMEATQRVSPFLGSFAIGRTKRLIDVFRNSEIPLIYDQKVDNKKDKFDPNSYPD